jgi:hypothetical protein
VPWRVVVSIVNVAVPHFFDPYEASAPLSAPRRYPHYLTVLRLWEMIVSAGLRRVNSIKLSPTPLDYLGMTSLTPQSV